MMQIPRMFTVVPTLLRNFTQFSGCLLLIICVGASATPLPILKFQPSRSQLLEAHSKMQKTCEKWGRWYKRDKTENARVNMNIACRQAAEFAKNELGMKVKKAKFVAAKASKKKRSKPKATLLSAKKVGKRYTGRPKCAYWEAQVDKIRSKLRAGYKEPQGNKLRQKRRNYWRLIRDNC